MSTFSVRHFLAISTLLASTLSFSAHADGVYLLQLGSFEKKEEANAKWQSLQKKYPQLLEGLNVRLQDVTLPPDNFTVYRTQAGALKSRANAQSICDRLSQSGDECYVVETAMVASSTDELKRTAPLEQKPTVTSSAPAPKTPQAVAPVVAAVAATGESKSPFGVIGTPPTTQQVPAIAKAALPDAPVTPSVVADAKTSAALPAPSPISAPLIKHTEPASLPTTSARTLSPKEAMREERKHAGVAAATTVPTPVMEPSIPVPEAPKAQVPVAADQAEEESGFWSTIQSLDPFYDDEKELKNAKTPELAASIRPQTVDMPTPAATKAAAVMEDKVDRGVPPLIIPETSAAAVVAATPSPSSSIADQIEFVDGPGYTVPAAEGTAAIAPSAEPNLPPPPPMPTDADLAIQRAQSASGLPAAAASSPMPVAPAIAPRPDLPPPPPVPAQPIPNAVPSMADVSVSEAVRVPLSEEAVTPARPTFTPPMAMGLPSQQTPGRKTMWAQISYFPDQQAALAYWEGFRKANPTFPAVRVRITNPYAIQSSTPQVSLRVGPFDRGDYVKDICDEVETQEIYCKAVTDLGESTTARTNRDRLASRYENYYAAGSQSATEMYWVQLGSFLSPGDAQNAWAQMAQTYSPVLNGLDPNVAPPVMGSSMQSVYRLRSGPFPLRNKADELCGRLRAKGNNCLIVFSR